MSLFYKIAYQLGFTPWERASETHGHMIAKLLDREERNRARPFGSALDLGCGSGLWTVELARRSWQVVGVDNVRKALSTARERAKAAGVDAHFIHGDVTALQESGVGSDFNFLIDLGCFHGLNDEQRIAMGRAVTAVAAPNALLMELVWAPARRGPLPRGASRNDLSRCFPGWEIVADDALDASALPGPLRNADPRCYFLRHAG